MSEVYRPHIFSIYHIYMYDMFPTFFYQLQSLPLGFHMFFDIFPTDLRVLVGSKLGKMLPSYRRKPFFEVSNTIKHVSNVCVYIDIYIKASKHAQ